MMNKENYNIYNGELAEGCKLCMKGAKLVLFISGICNRTCYYCPLSTNRKGSKKSWANERPVQNTQDVINEAKRMKALGAGITGGDPDLTFDKTLLYIQTLKETFSNFHIHMYTSNPLSVYMLKQLKDSGLDELRYHVVSTDVWKSIKKSKALGIDTGIELPVIPHGENQLGILINKAISLNIDFINLNELEFSHTNCNELLKRDFEIDERGSAVRGSYTTGLNLLKKYQKKNIHLCTSRYKDAVQLKNRLQRIAKNTVKKYEEITKQGLLIKGVIIPNSQKMLTSLRKNLIKNYSIPPDLIYINESKNRIETTQEIACFLSDTNSENLKCFLIEEYPTYDAIETEVIPL
tara:strand:+ start:1916 stop:2965 length:1050 start_codon:yes stop_codon:yes gene_type:complete